MSKIQLIRLMAAPGWGREERSTPGEGRHSGLQRVFRYSTRFSRCSNDRAAVSPWRPPESKSRTSKSVGAAPLLKKGGVDQMARRLGTLAGTRPVPTPPAMENGSAGGMKSGAAWQVAHLAWPSKRARPADWAGVRTPSFARKGLGGKGRALM